MDYLAMPLRPLERRLGRTGAREAFATLLRVMAITPAGVWAGGEHFGLNELLTGAPLREKEAELRDARDETQLALAELGITCMSVRRVLAQPLVSRGDTRGYVFEMISASSELETFRVELHQ